VCVHRKENTPTGTQITGTCDVPEQSCVCVGGCGCVCVCKREKYTEYFCNTSFQACCTPLFPRSQHTCGYIYGGKNTDRDTNHSDVCDVMCVTSCVWRHVQHAMTICTENATLPSKSTKSRNSESSVSRGTNSIWDFGRIWFCTQEFEFLDSVEFGVVACPVDSTIRTWKYSIYSLYIWGSLCITQGSFQRYLYFETTSHPRPTWLIQPTPYYGKAKTRALVTNVGLFSHNTGLIPALLVLRNHLTPTIKLTHPTYSLQWWGEY